MRSLLLRGILLSSVGLMSVVSDHVTQDALAIPLPHIRKIELPVSWQLTRTRLAGASSSTVTETYRETWLLEIQVGGVYQLQTPRDKVPAYVSEGLQGPSETVPTSLTVSETDFGKLIGVRRSDADTATSIGLERPVIIQLAKKKKTDADILLTWSEDEHYSIQLDFSPAVFL